MITEVTNLATGEQQTFSLTPHEAVRAAWQYANGKRPTVNPADDKAPRLVVGDRSIACGDWCALHHGALV